MKQGNTGSSLCLMVCKKYLSKGYSPLKPRKEPEFAVLLQLTISVKPEGSISHLSVVLGQPFGHLMLSSGDRRVLGSCFTMRLTEHCHRWPRGGVESPFLEIFKNHLDMVLGNRS